MKVYAPKCIAFLTVRHTDFLIWPRARMVELRTCSSRHHELPVKGACSSTRRKASTSVEILRPRIHHCEQVCG